MMNEQINKFILENKNRPIAEVALLLGKKKDFPKEYILNQINGFQRTKAKLPEWHHTKGIIFPDGLALEQASSERSAKFKAQLVEGKTMADLTGGMGIDCYYFSKAFKKVHYIEPDEARLQAAQHNFAFLDTNNVSFHHSTAAEFLKTTKKLDFIYIDPDRRTKNKKQVQIEDCVPDLSTLQEDILSKSKILMLKYSPLLDISQALEKLVHVKEIYIVSIKNECKELLFIIEDGFVAEAKISAINLLGDRNTAEDFTFYPSEEHAAVAAFGKAQKYFYDPNTSIKKAGAFKLVSKRFGLKKLHANTHLYTSDQYLSEFPGRVFELIKKVGHKEIKNQQLNVISRNYPMTAQQLKKKFKLKDGGNEFLIACSLFDSSKGNWLCTRVK